MKIKKIFSLIFIILLFLPLFIFADGGTIRRLPEGTWDWVDQNSQEAFINYQNGIEKLIIGVDLQKEFSEAFWIIPIPGKPEDVKIDVVSSLPRFYGWEVTKKARWALDEPISALPYPIILPAFFLVSLSGARAGARKGVEGGDVAVVAHIEKGGMIAEVLTAKTDQALYDYLSEKGLKIERGAISVFNQYIGKDYSFVVSWIPSEKPEELTGGERGIYITFPTSKIYYPLIPTSAYGEKEIPITIRILGYVKPKIYSEIKPYLETEYYTEAERYGWGASLARCQSDIYQLRSLFELYFYDYETYPFSILEAKTKETSYQQQFKTIFEDIEKFCPSNPLYQLASDGKNYTLSVFLGNGREYFISATQSGQRDVPPPQELKDFYGDKEVWKGNSQYTKITINAPSENFVKDLWIKPGTPLRVLLTSGIADFAAKYPGQTTLFLVALLSFLVGGIAGKICFGKFKKYALVGLSNLLTIIGLIIVISFVKKEENPKFSKPFFVGLFFVIYFISSIFLFPIFLYFLLALFL
jgi:hypothetical protein